MYVYNTCMLFYKIRALLYKCQHVCVKLSESLNTLFFGLSIKLIRKKLSL